MPRVANMDVARTVDGVAIYVDYAHLPDDEAIKKSKIRRANQAAAAKRKGEGVTLVQSSKRVLAPRAVTEPESVRKLIADRDAAVGAIMDEYEKLIAEAREDAEMGAKITAILNDPKMGARLKMIVLEEASKDGK